MSIKAAEDATLGGTTLSGTGGNNINITGNAGTATKLKTATTIWGQSFDGSAAITGAITGATDITATGTVTANKFSGSLEGTAESANKVNHTLTMQAGTNKAVTFNGSEDASFSVTADNIGALTDVSIATAAGSAGNVLKDITISTDGTTRKITKSYDTMVTKISSTDFNVSSATASSPTINLKTTAAAGVLSLLDATSLTATSGTNKLLNFGGYISGSQFYATNLYGTGSGTVQLAQTMPTSVTLSGVSDTTNYYSSKLRILVAKTATKSATGALDTYTFVDSGIAITDSGTDKSSTSVPTSKAMHSAIESAVSTGVNCLTLSSTGKTVSGSLPASVRIDHIDMYYKTGFTTATFSVSIGSTDLVSVSENDATESDSLYTFKVAQLPSTSASTISLKSTSDAVDTTGDVTAYIYYSK